MNDNYNPLDQFSNNRTIKDRNILMIDVNNMSEKDCEKIIKYYKNKLKGK